MKLIIFILIIIFLLKPNYADANETAGHVYVGATEVLGLASIRVGGPTWEAGFLNRSGIGFARILRKGGLYAMGGALYTVTSSVGLFGTMGKEWNFWNVMAFRIEANIGHSIDNYSSAEVQIGLSVGW